MQEEQYETDKKFHKKSKENKMEEIREVTEGTSSDLKKEMSLQMKLPINSSRTEGNTKETHKTA